MCGEESRFDAPCRAPGFKVGESLPWPDGTYETFPAPFAAVAGPAVRAQSRRLAEGGRVDRGRGWSNPNQAHLNDTP